MIKRARKEDDEVSTSQEEPEVVSELVPTSTTESARSRRRTARGITSAEHVANELREAIHRGYLDSGDQINQQEWADKLGVSRAALREGLEAVATQSLLTHDPNRGYFVSTLTTPQAAQLYWLRICIEREVMLTVRRPSEAESADLKAACETAIDAWNSDDHWKAVEADRELLFRIYVLSPLDFLVAEAKRMWDLAEFYRAGAVLDSPASRLENDDYEGRKRRQLQAVLDHDPYMLAESVVLERRRVAELFMPLPAW